MDTAKKTFVLVHGAWHGGRVWRDADRLRGNDRRDRRGLSGLRFDYLRGDLQP